MGVLKETGKIRGFGKAVLPLGNGSEKTEGETKPRVEKHEKKERRLGLLDSLDTWFNNY